MTRIDQWPTDCDRMSRIMCTKSTSQQSAINESDIKHDEHDTLPSVNTTFPV